MVLKALIDITFVSLGVQYALDEKKSKFERRCAFKEGMTQEINRYSKHERARYSTEDKINVVLVTGMPEMY